MPPPPPPPPPHAPAPPPPAAAPWPGPGTYDAVVVGASAGAVEALGAVLPTLPASFPLPVALVVHVPPGRPSLLSSLFAARCRLPVLEAQDKQPLEPGTLAFAPPDYHLLVEPDLTYALSLDEPVHFSRPSIDVLFESAAEVLGPRLLGVVLTGASGDGARGLAAVRRAGGGALVQDPDSAQVRFMPEAAIAASEPQWVLGLEDIARFLRGLAPPPPRGAGGAP